AAQFETAASCGGKVRPIEPPLVTQRLRSGGNDAESYAFAHSRGLISRLQLNRGRERRDALAGAASVVNGLDVGGGQGAVEKRQLVNHGRAVIVPASLRVELRPDMQRACGGGQDHRRRATAVGNCLRRTVNIKNGIGLTADCDQSIVMPCGVRRDRAAPPTPSEGESKVTTTSIGIIQTEPEIGLPARPIAALF